MENVLKSRQISTVLENTTKHLTRLKPLSKRKAGNSLNNHHKSNLFNSFFWGGFECAAPKIHRGKRIDILKDTLHDIEAYCRMDYKLLKELGIATVREGLIWSSIDKGLGTYDFSRFEKIMEIARQEGVQQVWDLNHFEYPEDISNPFSEEFILRFRDYSVAAVRTMRKYQTGTIFIVPINEISFWTWISSDVGAWTPYKFGRGTEWKKILVKASIAAMDAIWAVDSNVRFIQVDPLTVRIPKDPTDKKSHFHVKKFRKDKFEAWDMLSGRVYPELGGNKKYLDLLGLNYYHTNQHWIEKNENLNNERLGLFDYHAEEIPLECEDRLPLRDLLQEVYDRYQRPLIITETGSYGNLREPWWSNIMRNIDEIRDQKILPLLGVCAYPIIDRPDWVKFHLTNSGLWDYKEGDLTCQRIPHKETIKIVQKYISKWNK
jgi:beta-glucosidase/6-phospho-beta-glucosidase/beta-galactosidase